jgi:hypothetical protein
VPPGNDGLPGATDMVEGVRRTGVAVAAPLARDAARTTADHFAVEDGAAPLNQNARLSSTPSIGLDSMLVLQAVDEGLERDRAARKRGTALLAALTKLQRSILAQDDPSSALDALNELTANSFQVEDPGLGAILRAVVLRSRVEIARRQR